MSPTSKLIFLFVFCLPVTLQAQKPTKPAVVVDPLPSWNEGPSKKAIMEFVQKTTKAESPDFIPVTDRIACFDNDGTLWSEQPYYFQLAFAVDRIKELAPQHPEWKDTSPFKEILAGDLKAALSGGEKTVADLMIRTHAGMSTDEFATLVQNWLDTAVHPKTGKPYTAMVYQPMLELLNYLRENEFKTFIVSGGGIDFMRVFSEKVYGIPPYQVVGSYGKVKYMMKDGKPTLMKLAQINFVDDKDGKPAGIHQSIGKRPVFTAGNSDGDYEMLQYTMAGSGPRFAMIVHHTDAVREFEYDRQSSIGRLDRALTDAQTNKWQMVDMKSEWKVIYPK